MAALPFQLTKQFVEGPEKLVATFADDKDAFEFMDAKVAWAHKTKMKVFFRLYSHSDLLKEINAEEFESVHSAETHEKNSSITPFGTAPRPTGIPSRRKDEDIDDENEQ